MKVTRSEAKRMLSEAKHEMRFSTESEKATRLYKMACCCKSAIDPFYCGNRSCENCYLTKDYHIVMDRIAFINETHC